MKRKQTIIAIAAAVVLLLGTSVAVVAHGRAEQTALAPSASASASPMLVAETQSLQSFQDSFREVAKKVLPVVVEINVTATVQQQAPQFQMPFPFFNQPGQGQQRQFTEQALGSGVIVQRSGERYYVLTNNHVVANATDISVKMDDGRVFKANIAGTDSRKDLAVVSFTTRDNIPVAELGDSSTLQVGDIVLAVGNPLGFESTVTMGIVSALGRQGQGDVSQYTDYIQTDAAINQGNSGGALVNINGQVVGINSWIAAPSGGNVGLGFAIPINNAKSDIQSLIASGKVSYGWLGVQITDIQDGTTYPNYSSDLKVGSSAGALALNVYKGSPADKAGLLPGDYVTKVDGNSIQNADQLTQVVGGLAAGKSYPFTLVRDGVEKTITVTIGVRDPNDNVAQYKNLWPGMTVLDLTDQVRQEAGVSASMKGVAVAYVPDQNTPAAIAGFQVGDVITNVNGHAVASVSDFYRYLNDMSRQTVSFTVQRQGTEVVVGLNR